MIDLVVLVVSVALVDSLNPTTILPALYLATGPRAVAAVLGFAGGFVAVNMVGGVAALVVGNRIADYIPRPSEGALHLVEIVVGLLAMAAACVVWQRRRSVEAAFAKGETRVTRVAPLAGATIAAVELPTAVPYFAVIAALAASNQGLAAGIALLLLFNGIFLAPVIAIALVRALAGQRATGPLMRARQIIQRRAGAVTAGFVLVLGVALMVLGAWGLVSD